MGAVEMRKDEHGRWINGKGEWLHTVILDQNRFIVWARNAQGAIGEVIWEHYTRRQRKAPAASDATVRAATDDEASSVLRRRPTRQTPVHRAQGSFDGIPRDPKLDQLLRDSPGIVGSDHPATSKQAARKISIKSGTQRHRVLHLIAGHGPDGVTDERIQSYGINANSERPRRIELLEAGFVEAVPYTEATGKTAAGLDATLWRVTPKGQAALDACGAVKPPS